MPSFKLKIRTEDGAVLEAHGPCTEEQTWAMWMLKCWFKNDSPKLDPHQAAFVRAVERFKKSARLYRHRCDVINDAEEKAG